jgi:hypothetical protein
VVGNCRREKKGILAELAGLGDRRFKISNRSILRSGGDLKAEESSHHLERQDAVPHGLRVLLLLGRHPELVLPFTSSSSCYGDPILWLPFLLLYNSIHRLTSHCNRVTFG